MSITTSVSTSKPSSVKVELLFFAVHNNEVLEQLPAVSRRGVRASLKKRDFVGGWGAGELIVSPGRVRATHLGVVGLGNAAAPLSTRLEGLRRGVAKIMMEVRLQALRDVAIVLPNEDAAEFAAAAYESVVLSDYRFDEYQESLQKEQLSRSMRKLVFVTESSNVKDVRERVAKTESLMSGVTLARDLVNQPASHMSPEVLVEVAEKIAKKSVRLDLEVMDQRQAQAKNFSAFLAVARGSSEEPYVIHLSYTPRRKAKKSIYLIGKGIMFDSGGLSLKPAASMETMKVDMAGAATVLGLFSILPNLDLDVEVHGVIAACENMPSGTAYRPGDVITAKNGKTIEILNTDAEGRVTMADALSYAVEQKPDMIVDLATLTGAAVVALGETYAGLWSNRGSLKKLLMEAAEKTGEGMVPLPLPEEYKPMIRSKVADVRNTSMNGSYAGATTAALFLQEFVSNTPWAHIDIAGPSYAEKPVLPYYPFGGTGYGVRMLAEFLRNID